MLIVKILECVGPKTTSHSGDGKRQFISQKVIVSSPYFTEDAVHASTRIIRVTALASTEIKPGSYYHISVSKNGKYTNYFVNGAA